MRTEICLPTNESGPVRLDPRSPLVLDTRELGRRPGSERRLSLTASAPADLGIEVLRVPEGSPVAFELRLEAVVEGVLVTGSAHARLSGECARCLEEIGREMEADFCELFVYDGEAAEAETAEDGETSRLEGDLLDLEPVLRDAVVLALPFRPLCAEDCPGLCVECGARLVEDPGHSHEATVDPRWAALQGLTVAPSGLGEPSTSPTRRHETTGRSSGPSEE